MLKNVLLSFLGLTCALVGYFSFVHLPQVSQYPWLPWAGMLVGGGVPILAVLIERWIRQVPLSVLVGGTVGLALGLMLARLLSLGFEQLQKGFLGAFSYVMLSIFFGYLGLVLGGKKIQEIHLPESISQAVCYVSRCLPRKEALKGGGQAKVLDTSAIIDARLADICEAGWLEGPLIVPTCVLAELQHIADSTEPSKRTRGRRGLEALERIKNLGKIEVHFLNQDFPEIKETDAKLVRLCRELGAKLITIDYNLNKVARLEGVEVLNVNELSLALRPIVSAGEKLRVRLLKEGKEKKQGVGYLEDGTMIVVENGRSFIGQEVEVAVTSLLQTPAGRIIFAQIRPSQKSKAA